MRKIVLVEIIPSLHPVGGAQTFFRSLCEAFATNFQSEIELHCIFLYNKQDNFIYESFDAIDCKKYFLGKKKGIDFKCAHLLRSVLKKIKPDIVHSHLETLATLFLAFPFKKNFKIVHTIHNMVGPEFKLEKLAIIFTKLNFLYPVCVSENSALSLSKYVKRDVEFVNNGVEIEKFNNSITVDKRDIDFLCVGSFTPVKNHNFLINCFKQFRFKKNTKLFCLGDGPTKFDFENQIKMFRLDKTIFCLGVVSNVSEFMSRSKILLLPSISEGNPMVVNEAIASGMFVIANDVGGLSNIVNKDQGILIQKNDLNGFCKAMELINNTEFLEEKRIKNLNSSVSIQKTCQDYVKIFNGRIKK